MIQELLGGGASTEILGGERKIATPGVLPSPSPSSSPATTPAVSSVVPKTSENQNLRCPRCDSPNTKFCYYNNYNLTQPRHFCKTCRRYWTKGGALRNVPIGGGCRQNRSTIVAASPVGKSISTTKLKTLGMSSDIEKSIFMGGFNHELSSNPIFWSGPSQSSHLLALLKATTQNPNPNPNFSSSMANSEALFSARNIGLDSMSQAPSIGFGSSFWKNNIQNQSQQEQQQNGGFVLGEIQNNIGGNSNQFYQWLRSSPGANYYHPDHTPNVAASICSTSPSSTILDSAPVAGDGMGFWNPALSWSDLSTANGAYP